MDFSELLILGFMALVLTIIIIGFFWMKHKRAMYMLPKEKDLQTLNSATTQQDEEDENFSDSTKNDDLYDRLFKNDTRNPSAMSAIEDYDETRRLREGIGSSMSFGSLSDTTNIGSLGSDKLI